LPLSLLRVLSRANVDQPILLEFGVIDEQLLDVNVIGEHDEFLARGVISDANISTLIRTRLWDILQVSAHEVVNPVLEALDFTPGNGFAKRCHSHYSSVVL